MTEALISLSGVEFSYAPDGRCSAAAIFASNLASAWP